MTTTEGDFCGVSVAELKEKLSAAQDALGRAERAKEAADYTESFTKMQAEKADANARIKQANEQIERLEVMIASAEQNEAGASAGDDHARA